MPFPSPGDLSDPGIEPTSLMSPALADRFFTTSATFEGVADKETPWNATLEKEKRILSESPEEAYAADLENKSCKLEQEERIKEGFPKGKKWIQGIFEHVELY